MNRFEIRQALQGVLDKTKLKRDAVNRELASTIVELNETASAIGTDLVRGPRFELELGEPTPLMFRKVKSPLPKPTLEPDPMLVHAQNVHDYFIKHHAEHHWDNLASFTCVRPCFPQLLIVYDHRFTLHPDGTKVDNLRRIAVSVTQRTTEYFQYYLRPEANPTGYDPKLAEKGRLELIELVKNAQPDHFLEMVFSIDARPVPGRWFVMLSSIGSVIIYGPFGYIIINSPQELSYLDTINMPEVTQENFCAKHGAIALATIQFMNCRNVEVIDNPPSRQQRRHAERTGEPPPTTYKTLIIHPIGKRRAKSAGAASSTGIEMALHICRGHFKDYRQGSGLGRWHRHGVWWWSPCVKGSAERGRVVKDYDVEVSE